MSALPVAVPHIDGIFAAHVGLGHLEVVKKNSYLKFSKQLSIYVTVNWMIVM